MISTVTIRRESAAQGAIEHPDEWDDAQINAAVTNRAIDVAARADMWVGQNRTTVDGIEPGTDYRDEWEGDYKPEPVALTDEDL